MDKVTRFNGYIYGEGLPGMFVTPFAKSITLTDYDTDALELLSNNLNLNFNGNIIKSDLIFSWITKEASGNKIDLG